MGGREKRGREEGEGRQIREGGGKRKILRARCARRSKKGGGRQGAEGGGKGAGGGDAYTPVRPLYCVTYWNI